MGHREAVRTPNLFSAVEPRLVRALFLTLAFAGGCAPSDDASLHADDVAGDAVEVEQTDTPDSLAAERRPLGWPFGWWRRDAGTQPTPNDAGPRRDAGAPDAPRDAGVPSPADAGTTPPIVDAGAPSSGSCGGARSNPTPFGCSFAWGTPDDKVKSFPNVQFTTKWIGYEVDKAGKVGRCDGCTWLRDEVAKTSLVPVYYAYFIGFFGSANGLADQNVNPNGPNLATDASKLIRDNRAKVIDMYAQYARASRQAYPDRPVVWLLEGDFVQYTYKEQKQALSYAELGALARDIACAIKSNMPNAVVAINHSTWLSNEVTNDFWNAMKGVSYDMVWTTGVAGNKGYLEAGANDSTYNAKTATFRYISQLTGRKILVDTSFGLSAMADSWSTASVQTLNERIADGVIAANVVSPAASFSQTIRSIAPQLTRVCR